MTAKRWWTLALTSVAFFMVTLGLLVVVTALPAMRRDLGASLSTLSWIVNAQGITFGAGVITAAALGDRLGRVRIFTIGLAVFTLASAAGGLAHDVNVLIAARALQGVGSAMIMPLSLTILSAAFPPERRGVVIGLWGGIAGIGVAAGPLVGGAVTQGLDWHWVFWLNVPLGVLATILAPIVLTESRGPATRLDLLGVTLVTLGAFALIWGLVRGNDAGWTSQEVLAAFAIGIVLVIAFALWESRASAPLLPPHLIRNATFVAANATAFLMTAALLGSAFLIAQYFQFVLRNQPFDTGLRLLPWTATPIVIAPLAGALSDRIGRPPLMVVGMVLNGIGLGWFAIEATTGVAYSLLILPMIIAGVGVSMALPTTPAAALNAVAPRDMGKASGVNGTLQRFGGVFGVAIGSAVFAANGHLGTPVSFDAGFRPALTWLAGFAILGAVSALAVAGRPRLVEPVLGREQLQPAATE